MCTHVINPSTREAEVGGMTQSIEFKASLEVYSDTFS